MVERLSERDAKQLIEREYGQESIKGERGPSRVIPAVNRLPDPRLKIITHPKLVGSKRATHRWLACILTTTLTTTRCGFKGFSGGL